jgi:SnoaL-like domain
MAASTETGPVAAVHRFIEAFNDDDVDLAQAACVDETSIIDDFPPYQWTGHGATTRWYRDMAGMAEVYGMSDWSVVLDQPRHLTVSDQRAYVVVPVTARWLEDGTSADRTGYLTAALQELADEWRVSAFTWAWS